jgi:hypothetical protein
MSWPVHLQACTEYPLTVCGLGHHDRVTMEVVTKLARVTCKSCRKTLDYRQSVADPEVAKERNKVRVVGRANSAVPEPWKPIGRK